MEDTSIRKRLARPQSITAPIISMNGVLDNSSSITVLSHKHGGEAELQDSRRLSSAETRAKRGASIPTASRELVSQAVLDRDGTRDAGWMF